MARSPNRHSSRIPNCVGCWTLVIMKSLGLVLLAVGVAGSLVFAIVSHRSEHRSRLLCGFPFLALGWVGAYLAWLAK